MKIPKQLRETAHSEITAWLSDRDKENQSRLRVCDFLVDVVREMHMIEPKELFDQFAQDQGFEVTSGTLREMYNTGLMWPPEWRADYPSIKYYSAFRALKKDGKPDFELAQWAEDNKATVGEIWRHKSDKRWYDLLEEYADKIEDIIPNTYKSERETILFNCRHIIKAERSVAAQDE